jgi:4-hydroxythreonine-4-phosphate dehydrogenase
MEPVIAFTMGDFNGIGPEIILKSISSGKFQPICRPLIIGSVDVFEFYARHFRMKMVFQEIDTNPMKTERGLIPVYNIRKFHRPRIKPGSLSQEAGKYAGEAISIAAELVKRKLADGIVTAPVSKEALNMGGYRYPGQTEMLAHYFKTADTLMLFSAKKMKMGLATTHLPISRVSREISRNYLIKKIRILHSSLKKDFAVQEPAIAVLSLNPHAGEGGLLGKEERESIIPAIQAARRKGIQVEGPFPSDAFFGSRCERKYDAILALYHDQGLIPFKISNFENGVNVTAGLPTVRTSPDHGTAFNIAGKGIANPSSFIEAVKTAVEIINNRKRNR